MLSWRNIVLLGSFLVPSFAFAQSSQPASAPSKTSTTNPQAPDPVFPYAQPDNPAFPYAQPTNPQPVKPQPANPLFPYGNPTPSNNTNALAVAAPKDRSSLAPGIFYGGAATFGIVGLVGSGLAISFKARAKQAATLGPNDTPSQEQATKTKQLLASTKTAAILSDISFGLSVSGLVGGYLLSRRAKASQEASPNPTTY